jgi:ribonuclease HII
MAQLYGHPVAGIDEAGRGPWAGPVVAAAVILDSAKRAPAGLHDSKQLGESEREELFLAITAQALAHGVGVATVEEIDRINIRQATHLAMRRAYEALVLSGVVPSAVLVDGDDSPPFEVPTRALIDGDAKAYGVAAASIVAKVTRDRMMAELDVLHPGYGFARHKGYGTRAHSEALLRLGTCPCHRASFSPVALALEAQRSPELPF